MSAQCGPGARVSLGPAGPLSLSLSCSAPICFIEAVKLLSGVARGQVLSGRQLVPSPLLHQPGEERGGGLVTK